MKMCIRSIINECGGSVTKWESRASEIGVRVHYPSRRPVAALRANCYRARNAECFGFHLHLRVARQTWTVSAVTTSVTELAREPGSRNST